VSSIILLIKASNSHKNLKVILNSQTTLRIWDCLFYEGTKIIFRVALTLIKRNRSNLLACQDFTTLAECFKEITKDSIVLRCHEFMQVCGNMLHAAYISNRKGNWIFIETIFAEYF